MNAYRGSSWVILVISLLLSGNILAEDQEKPLLQIGQNKNCLPEN